MQKSAHGSGHFEHGITRSKGLLYRVLHVACDLNEEHVMIHLP